ncbi:unnamed protein product [Linum tenue]|nr:unnamed protein product [Linum tenue]
MLGLAALPALLVGFAVVFMPESPRWLVMKGRFAEAKRVLIKTSSSEEEVESVDSRVNEMVKASLDLPSNGPSWHELISPRSNAIRRIVIAAIGVNFFMQASGNDAVVYYSPEVFKDAGISSKRQLVGVTVIMGVAKASFALVSALFLDRFGRRPLLLLGSTGMAVSLALLGLGSKYLDQCQDVTMCIVAVCGFVSFFSIGLGPITWVYSSEIFPLRLRAQGSGLAISVNRLVSGVVSMTFLTVSMKISFGGMFFVLGGIMVVGTVFFYVVMPETKGKSLEEIQFLFQDKEGGDVETKEVRRVDLELT